MRYGRVKNMRCDDSLDKHQVCSWIKTLPTQTLTGKTNICLLRCGKGRCQLKTILGLTREFNWHYLSYLTTHLNEFLCLFQLEKVLDSGEARTIKNALSEFHCTRQLDDLLFHLYPILHGPDTQRQVIWLYILQCLTDRERDFLSKKLLELNQNIIPGTCWPSSGITR